MFELRLKKVEKYVLKRDMVDVLGSCDDNLFKCIVMIFFGKKLLLLAQGVVG